jgi:hypothetical protein
MPGKWCSFSTAENEKIEKGFTDLLNVVSAQCSRFHPIAKYDLSPDNLSHIDSFSFVLTLMAAVVSTQVCDMQ